VAGTLGRKIGDKRTAEMMKGITECRVEIMSTRQKARLLVPAAPENSVESNSLVDGTDTDARLSLSATDQHVQVELPGVGVADDRREGQAGENWETGGEMTPEGANIAEPRRITLTSVKVPCGKGYLCEGIDQISGGGMRPTEGLFEGGGIDEFAVLASMEIMKSQCVATTAEPGDRRASIAMIPETGAKRDDRYGGKTNRTATYVA